MAPRVIDQSELPEDIQAQIIGQDQVPQDVLDQFQMGSDRAILGPSDGGPEFPEGAAATLGRMLVRGTNSAAFNLGDDIAGLFSTQLGEDIRQSDRRLQQENPVASFTSEAIGAATPYGAAKALGAMGIPVASALAKMYTGGSLRQIPIGIGENMVYEAGRGGDVAGALTDPTSLAIGTTLPVVGAVAGRGAKAAQGGVSKEIQRLANQFDTLDVPQLQKGKQVMGIAERDNVPIMVYQALNPIDDASKRPAMSAVDAYVDRAAAKNDDIKGTLLDKWSEQTGSSRKLGEDPIEDAVGVGKQETRISNALNKYFDDPGTSNPLKVAESAYGKPFEQTKKLFQMAYEESPYLTGEAASSLKKAVEIEKTNQRDTSGRILAAALNNGQHAAATEMVKRYGVDAVQNMPLENHTLAVHKAKEWLQNREGLNYAEKYNIGNAKVEHAERALKEALWNTNPTFQQADQQFAQIAEKARPRERLQGAVLGKDSEMSTVGNPVARTLKQLDADTQKLMTKDNRIGLNDYLSVENRVFPLAENSRTASRQADDTTKIAKMLDSVTSPVQTFKNLKAETFIQLDKNKQRSIVNELVKMGPEGVQVLNEWEKALPILAKQKLASESSIATAKSILKGWEED